MAFAAAAVNYDIVECPICLDNFNNPRSLPCIHTFCQKCIRDYCKGKRPGDSAQCPTCRSQFKIPASGIDDLPHNFFIQSLVEANVAATKGVTDGTDVCEVCKAEHAGQWDRISTATTFCVDCCQKLCNSCSAPHRRWKGGAHLVKSLSEVAKTEMVEMQGNYCERHPGKLVELYCTQCKTNICLVCFALNHQQHKCEEIAKAAAGIVSGVEERVKQILLCVGEFEKDAAKTNENKNKFIAEMAQLEKSITDKAVEIKRLVDSHFSQLISELTAIKTEAIKNFEISRDKLETELLSLRSFSAYWMHLKSKGRPTDITRAVVELNVRASQLVDTYERSRGPWVATISVRFEPNSNVVDPRNANRTRNFVGTLTRSKPAPLFSDGERRLLPGQKVVQKPTPASAKASNYYNDELDF